MLGGAGCADDVGAAGLGYLDGEMADAAGRRVDQDALSWLDVGGVHECLVRGEGGQWQGTGLNMVDAGGLVGEGTGGGGHVLGVGATPPWG